METHIMWNSDSVQDCSAILGEGDLGQILLGMCCWPLSSKNCYPIIHVVYSVGKILTRASTRLHTYFYMTVILHLVLFQITKRTEIYFCMPCELNPSHLTHDPLTYMYLLHQLSTTCWEPQFFNYIYCKQKYIIIYIIVLLKPQLKANCKQTRVELTASKHEMSVNHGELTWFRS